MKRLLAVVLFCSACGGAPTTGLLYIDLTAVHDLPASAAASALVIGDVLLTLDPRGPVARADHERLADGHVALAVDPFLTMRYTLPIFPDGDYLLYLFLDENGDGTVQAGERGAIVPFTRGAGAIVLQPSQLTRTLQPQITIGGGTAVADGASVTCSIAAAGLMPPGPGPYTFTTGSAKMHNGSVALPFADALVAGRYSLGCSSPNPTATSGSPYLQYDLRFDGAAVTVDGSASWRPLN